MIDTHCHLTDPRLAEQLPGVLLRASQAGVKRMVTIGTTPDDWKSVIALCRRHSNIRCAIGIHPNESADAPAGWHERLPSLLKDPTVAAAGEMGLDYHYEHSPRELQQKFFAQQLGMAAAANLPVIVHSRESVADCLTVMRDFRLRAAVFHCFTGTPAEADPILSAGYWLGFTGVVTFKKTDALREVAKRTPADRLLVETDAPYLSPEPKRNQKVNEPALVMYTAAAVAAARGVTLEAIDQLTTENAQRFYAWP